MGYPKLDFKIQVSGSTNSKNLLTTHCESVSKQSHREITSLCGCNPNCQLPKMSNHDDLNPFQNPFGGCCRSYRIGKSNA